MKPAIGGSVFLALALGASAADWSGSGTTWDGSWGAYHMTVDASDAGRVVLFQYRNLDAIEPGGDQGAFFLPAPQARWVPQANWPPPASFYDSAYSASTDSDGAQLVLVGPVDAYTKLRVTKRFSYDAAADKMSMTYVTTNTASDSARHFAPWETSRGFSGSLLFFPKATNFKFSNPPGSGLQPDLPLTRDDSLGWYLDLAGHAKGKFFRDGAEGWMAQLKDSLLFVKQYADVDTLHFPPGESDVEGYTDGDYIENEVLGAWVLIPPGDSLSWTVKWGCAILPKNADLQVGSEDLKKAARALVGSPTTSLQPVRAGRTRSDLPTLFDARGRPVANFSGILRTGSVAVPGIPRPSR